MLRIEQLACRLASALTVVFFIALTAQRRKFAIKDSKVERRLLIKGQGGNIQLRIIERLEGRVKKYPATTPSCSGPPAAYYSWGVALVWHGSSTVTEANLKDANPRGPHWADPLKAWSDVLAKQGSTKDWQSTTRRSNTRRIGRSLKKHARRQRITRVNLTSRRRPLASGGLALRTDL
jgi:hypothetical protein